ncbi:MAG: hypothetical protein GF307_13680 [candidate division Zixibacteria bacterium]|nr:hypothetical protein [candidate division Zixibacteria bacterium]
MREHLIAYWRRKKGIPPYSNPKYSKSTVLELWERYGNDDQAGDELGITGNAFRYWRKKYKIIDKPLRLKYEQIQLPLPGMEDKSSSRRKLSFVQKIILKKRGEIAGGRDSVQYLKPDRYFIAGEDSIFNDSINLNKLKIKNPQKVTVLDSGYIDKSATSGFLGALNDYAHFVLPTKGGLIYQTLTEGRILPGDLAVSTDNGILGIGGIGAVGIKIDCNKLIETFNSDQIPISNLDAFRINLLDTPRRFIEPLDIILFLSGRNIESGFRNCIVEFSGSALETMDIDKRFSLCYLSSFLNCFTAGIACNKEIEKIIRKIALIKFDKIGSDPGALHGETIHQSVLEIEPQAGVYEKGEFILSTVNENVDEKISTIIVGLYSGGMLNDINDIAESMGNKRIANSVKFYIRPATAEILLNMVHSGVFARLIEAGCSILPPAPHLLDFSLSSVSSSSGNILISDPLYIDDFPKDFEGKVFIANHRVAAISAVHGTITDPRP